MAFINEYIAEADYERYDLRKIIGEKNPFQPGYLFARDWTVDRDKEVFLVKIWTHREAEFDGWAFYWKGEWMFFEMRIHGIGKNAIGEIDWIGYLAKGFSLPTSLAPVRPDVIYAFEQSLTVYAGAGVISTCSPCAAKIEYMADKG